MRASCAISSFHGNQDGKIKMHAVALFLFTGFNWLGKKGCIRGAEKNLRMRHKVWCASDLLFFHLFFGCDYCFLPDKIKSMLSKFYYFILKNRCWAGWKFLRLLSINLLEKNLIMKNFTVCVVNLFL